MTNYDFSTLNSSDFEELICDLFNAEKGNGSLIYKTFKDGKDKGVDFLYSTAENRYFHVGQVKHYFRSGYSILKHTLEKTELAKVKKLNPYLYILATSVDLSVSETEEIKRLMSPFIRSVNDIYGKSDINKLVTKHSFVHDRHYKLWFSNTLVLRKLLNSNLSYRSVDFTEIHIQKRIALYVETEAFLQARIFLKANKYIVITGEPGVGKTTLAEMLTYEYIKEDYELIYVYDSITEADSALTSSNEKQIIYFDDFLGSNAIEINKARGSDAFLNKILRRVKNQENKLLIFTTRKHILTRAVQESEKLKRFNLLAKERILHLDEYTSDIKSQLLKNHIEYSELEDKYKLVLNADDIFNFIVKHKYFSPRSVEYIVSPEVVGSLNEDEYKNFIKESFDHPTEILGFAYSKQLNNDDRLLLNTLITFGTEVEYSELEKAFEYRLNEEVKTNNMTRSMHAFKNAYLRLLGGFIYSTETKYIRFINHSLLDFLLNHIQEDKVELQKIINSVIFVQQLTERLFPLVGPVSNPMPPILIERILTAHEDFIKTNNDDTELLKLAILLNKYIPPRLSDDVVENILLSIEDWAQFYDDFELSDAFDEFLDRTQDNPKIKDIISDHLDDLITNMVLSESDYDRALAKMRNLLKKFKLDINNINVEPLNAHFEEILNEELENEVDMLLQFMHSEHQAEDLRNEINSKAEELKSIGLSPKIDLSLVDGYNWYEIAIENYISEQMLKDD